MAKLWDGNHSNLGLIPNINEEILSNNFKILRCHYYVIITLIITYHDYYKSIITHYYVIIVSLLLHYSVIITSLLH